ncbi:MAG: glycosyltransferase [Timaviella obliquedivisa GSE-PSE-MK23-08B]|nr:glycosyltransferase [Timaviella obliquedivisa GSE-PSE-MK23-08B]
MKIAILSSGFLPVVDGVTVAQMNRLRWLSRWGHEVLLFCPDYQSIEKVYPNWREFTGQILPGVRIVNLASTPYMGIEFERNVSSKSYETVLRELVSFQPDVIHVDEPERLANGLLRFPGIKFAKKIGIPCVSFFHTNFVEYAEDFLKVPMPILRGLQFILRRLFAWVYNAYDVTLVGSQDAYEKVTQMGIRNGLRGNFLGVDLERFKGELQEQNFFEKQYGLENLAEKVKLVFVGRLTPDKGWKFAMNALEKMARQQDMSQIAILIAGEGEMRAEIAERLGKLAHFLGRIPPDDIPALLANCDVLVTASEKETRGLTILEGFATRLPAIAPHAGGVTDSIQDGVNGFLFAPGNVDDFAKKLNHLINDSDLRREMGRKGKESVQAYDWEQTIGNLVKAWEQEITRKRL